MIKVCEICGRTIEDCVKWNSKYAPKNLCIDHDHKTNKFRGLLCLVCNRQLGWYEKNKESLSKRRKAKYNKEYFAQWREKNREKYNEYQKEYKRKHRNKCKEQEEGAS